VVVQCSRCGVAPRECPGDRGLNADLHITWLVLIDDRIGEQRFCRACAPSYLISEIACAVCTDGPLLTGAIPEQPLSAWLINHGWQTVTRNQRDWVSPGCSRSS
jgi:hypothetical protein